MRNRAIEQSIFIKWCEQEKLSGRVLEQTSEFVLWRDLKQLENNANSIYWVLWFTDERLVTIEDLLPSDIPLLLRAKDCIWSTLSLHAHDNNFSLIVHNPPTIGRLHIQVIPNLSSIHHCGAEHLYTLAQFSVTLESVVRHLLLLSSLRSKL